VRVQSRKMGVDLGPEGTSESSPGSQSRGRFENGN
jgi:hypothetical protein